MPTILEKIAILANAYSGQDNLNMVLKAIGTDVAHEIIAEPRPIPPLKQVIEYGKIQLILDKKDENYLLLLSKHNKRITIAQRAIQNDTTLQDITFRLLVVNNPVETDNSDADLKTYIAGLTNELAQVTAAELAAIIPADETL